MKAVKYWQYRNQERNVEIFLLNSHLSLWTDPHFYAAYFLLALLSLDPLLICDTCPSFLTESVLSSPFSAVLLLRITSTSPGDGGSGSSTKWVIVGVAVGVVLLLLVGLSLYFLCFRRRKHSPELIPATVKTFSDSSKTKKISETTPTTQSWSISSEGLRYAVESLTLYNFEDLQKATMFFSEENKIKGSVYRASFKGDDAAVKILKGDVSSEINILKRINHANIIRLSGFCVHKGNTYLVYEFADNGSLDDWLHSDKKYQNSMSLSWIQKVQIAHDIADALNYLHNYANPPHVHKNLKSDSVLLDGNFRVKVSNFGLARVMENDEGFQLTRHVMGTQGYMAPEYIENGLITPKMDVFAFGVVILELLSGREVTSNGEEKKLLSLTVNEVLEGENVREKFRGFMDPTLRDEHPLDLAYTMAGIAKRCVAIGILLMNFNGQDLLAKFMILDRYS